MAVRESIRPVKPLSSDAVKPEHTWSLERFSERDAREAEALEEQVTARMRAELRSKLEEEMAHLKATAEAEARQRGYEAGFEAGRQEGRQEGYAAGLAAAQAEVERFRADSAALIDALRIPLAAWDEAVSQLIARIVRDSLERFLVRDAQASVALMEQQLAPVLKALQRREMPITLVAHPETVARLRSRLEGMDVSWQTDDSMPKNRVSVRQDLTEAVVDWQRLVQDYLIALEQSIQGGAHDPSADPPSETTA